MSKQALNLEAMERRARPIYDALDARNWKAALKLANAALNKHKDSHLIKALKAVALERAGKLDEAFKTCEEVRLAVPVDDHVLQTLCMVYRSVEKLGCLTEAYEAACQKQPKDYDLLVGLFGCYVREDNFPKQQLVAMQIHKLGAYPVRYFWWAVISLVLQAWGELSGVPSPLGCVTSLKLAKSMVSKHLKMSGAYDGFESLLLYLDILYCQDQPEGVPELLESKLASLCPQSSDRLRLQAQHCIRTGDLKAAASKLTQILRTDPDDWYAFILCMDCLLPSTCPKGVSSQWAEMFVESCQMAKRLEDSCSADQAGPGQVEDDDPKAAEAVVDLVASRVGEGMGSQEGANGENGGTSGDASSQGKEDKEGIRERHKLGEGKDTGLLRRRALADLEFSARKVKMGQQDHEQLADVLLNAFRQVGVHRSCAADLQTYVQMLNPDSGASLATKVMTTVSDLVREANAEGDDSACASKLTHALTGHKMFMDLGMPGVNTPEASASYARDVLGLFDASIPHLSALDNRELGPADDAVSVACAALMAAQRMQPTKDLNVWKAAAVVNAGVSHRPFNPRLVLDLCALFSLLGAPRLAAKHLQRLEVKYIQLDTLASHFSLPVLLSNCCHKEASELVLEMLALFQGHQRDAGETLLMAYQKGTYTKVLEFIAFKERLELSHSHYLAQVEKQMLELREACLHDLKSAQQQVRASCIALPLASALNGKMDNLRFNEDLGARPSWFSPPTGPYHLGVWDEWQVDGRPTEEERTYATWWTKPESTSGKEAGDWQEMQHRCLRRRWLLPHALSGLLMCNDGMGWIQGLEAIASDMETSLEDSLEFLEAQLQAHKTDDNAQGKSLRIYHGLTLALVSLAVPMQELICGQDGASAEADGPVQQVVRGVELVRAYFEKAIALEVASLKEGFGVRRCGGIVGALLHEEAAWLALAMQGWSRKILSFRKKKGSKGGDKDAVLPWETPLKAALKSLQGSYLEAMKQLQAALSAGASLAKEEEVARLAGLLQVDGDQDCWGFWPTCTSKDVLKMMGQVVGERVERLGQLARVADGRIRMASSVRIP
eukprot:evm.model.scf_292.2 EVM.evm.TU.scf_292.2   scf_292:7318-20147(-)